MTTDAELLATFARTNSEAAFAELVQRHVNLVYSAARRQVNSDEHLAKDVAQMVFTDLARKADSLSRRESLTGWLYTSAHFAAAKIVRGENRRRDREEKFMREPFAETAPDADWEKLRPMLDGSMHELKEADREAILLRYFENRPFAEVGAKLGLNENAARMRVERALEKLRDIFTKRGIATATALASVISANAVQLAPVGLAATISATAVLAGTAVQTSTVIAATKTIAMTTIQKTLITATLAVVAGAGIYEARQAAQLREQNQALQQQQAPLAEQNQQLQRERDDATNRLADLVAENSRLKSNPNQSELLKLRGQVGVLQVKANQPAKSKPEKSILEIAKSPEMREMMKASVVVSFDKVYAKLFADLKLTPEQISSLKQFITDKMIAGTTAKAMMLSGKITPDQIQQLNDQINAEQTGLDQQIQQVLGADGFAAYQAYEKTYTERSEIVGQMGFADQLTGGMELNSDQTEQLVQAMADERQQFKFSVDYSDPSKFAGDKATMFSDENISQYQKEMEQLNQLYLARAQSILTLDQQSIFQKFLSSRLAIQKMGLNMSAKMLGSKSASTK